MIQKNLKSVLSILFFNLQKVFVYFVLVLRNFFLSHLGLHLFSELLEQSKTMDHKKRSRTRISTFFSFLLLQKKVASHVNWFQWRFSLNGKFVRSKCNQVFLLFAIDNFIIAFSTDQYYFKTTGVDHTKLFFFGNANFFSFLLLSSSVCNIWKKCIYY